MISFSTFIEFISLQDPNVRFVVMGTVLLGISSGLVGSFMLLRKTALIGDAVAHAVLPGIAMAFMLFNTKNILVLLGGAIITGWISVFLIEYISNNSRLSADTAISLVLSVFFAAGIMLMTMIQQSGNASQSGLDHFLFGKAASLIGQDVYFFMGIAGVVIAVVLAFYKEISLMAFDRAYAQSLGIPVKIIDLIFATITVFTITIGIQAVGVVLMSALLITPAASARFWTHRLHIMLLLACLFGVISSVFGAYVSYAVAAMPTGPWIVVFLSAIAIVSILFAPKGGVWARMRMHRGNKRKILHENILKAFFHLGEESQDFNAPRGLEELITRRHFVAKDLKKGLNSLVKQGQLKLVAPDSWTLTEKGEVVGKRVVRVHRLWEMYLSKYLQLPPDHVHEGAEAIEHIITPELEKELQQLLDFPEKDPHEKDIPYHKPANHV